MNVELIGNGNAALVSGVDIATLTQEECNQIREYLLKHIVLVLKNQDTRSGVFTKFVSRIGPVGNHDVMLWNPLTGRREHYPKLEDGFIDPDTWPDLETYPVQRVTGEIVDKKASGIFSSGILDWHAGLVGPTRKKDGIALQAIRGVEGSSTLWVNTASALKSMPEDLLRRCKDVWCEYESSPEVWGKGMQKDQEKYMTQFKYKYKMWLLQENILGTKGLHFYTNNKCKVVTKDEALYQDLKDFVFQEKFMYEHFYEIGDIVLSDQLLSLHKRPQNDPEILKRRLLHRLEFGVSNTDECMWIKENNQNIG